MTRMDRIGSTVCTVVSLVGSACGPRLPPEATGSSAGVKEGMAAPGFELKATEGQTITMSGLQGKVVVLYFYPKDETPGCTKEACSFRDNHEEFVAAGAVVLGVSLDSTESHAKFVEANRLNFTLLSDPDGKVHTAYGAWKKGKTKLSAFSVDRSTFVVDRDGVVRKIWHDVQVPGHADEVLAFVKTLPAS